MIDFDDVFDAASLGFSLVTGIIGFIVVLGLVMVVLYFASVNEQKCFEMECADGNHAVLQDDTCLCISEPIKK